jgi:hypothetical protein
VKISSVVEVARKMLGGRKDVSDLLAKLKNPVDVILEILEGLKTAKN